MKIIAINGSPRKNFDADAKHQYRDGHIEEDKQMAFELGKSVIPIE